MNSNDVVGRLELKEVEDLQIDGVDTKDYPDFCDAYLCSGRHIKEDRELTDEELNQLQEAYPELVDEMAFESCL